MMCFTVKDFLVNGLLHLGASHLCGILLKVKRRPDEKVGQSFVLRKVFSIAPCDVTSDWQELYRCDVGRASAKTFYMCRFAANWRAACYTPHYLLSFEILGKLAGQASYRTCIAAFLPFCADVRQYAK